MDAGAGEINLGLEVRYTLRAFTRALSTIAPASGLTAAEFRLLRTLGEGEATTQAELASLAAMDRPYVSALVRGMTKRGLLTSNRNAEDRRRTDLALSTEGRRVLDSLSREIAQVNRVASKGIGAAELRVFTAVLARLRANLEHYV